MKLFRTLRLTFYAFFISGLAGAYFVYTDAISKPLNNRDRVLIVPRGVGDAWLANELEKQGIIENRYIARAYKWLNNPQDSIKPGEYTLFDTEDLPELVNKLIAGQVIQYALTLVEGKTFRDYREQLAKQSKLKQTLLGVSDSQVMDMLGQKGLHPEGMFAPETYFYQAGDSDYELLKQAFERMQKLSNAAWESRSSDSKLKSVYELITLASIVEKETGAAFERPLIAGVFNNRLKIGMRLQTDPTVIYGMGESYDGNIRRKDLRTDTPYNTYTRYGLPPTPIAMPGEAALMAAAQPKPTDRYYFVGKGDGTHYFSANLDEHNQAVVKYQLGGKPKKFSSYTPSKDG